MRGSSVRSGVAISRMTQWGRRFRQLMGYRGPMGEVLQGQAIPGDLSLEFVGGDPVLAETLFLETRILDARCTVHLTLVQHDFIPTRRTIFLGEKTLPLSDATLLAGNDSFSEVQVLWGEIPLPEERAAIVACARLLHPSDLKPIGSESCRSLYAPLHPH